MMISDEEFEKEKRDLQTEINQLKKSAVMAERYLENARTGALEVVQFVTSAPYEFAFGTIQKKREIARKLGITYRLTDGVLALSSVDAALPEGDRTPQKWL